MMATKIKDGGYAFPQALNGGGYVGSEGMSLRDYFAAKALTGMLSQPANSQNILAYDNPSVAVKWAYKFADKMLEAREGNIKS